MTEAVATLSAHSGCEIVSFDRLAALPLPEGTATFMPIPHSQLALSMKAVLDNMGYQVAREQYAIRPDGSKLFGTFDLTHTLADGLTASVGFRQGIDRSMKIQIVAGARVFVCDNMALSGDFIALSRKHTAGLNLLEELMAAFTRYFAHLSAVGAGVANLKAMVLDDLDAKVIMFDSFHLYEVMPLRFFKQVATAYFHPKHREFEPRTAWSLHNAYTEVIKALPLNLQLSASQKIGKVFELGAGSSDSQGQEVIE